MLPVGHPKQQHYTQKKRHHFTWVRQRANEVTDERGGVPGRIRTRDPLLRRQPLCPTELQGTSAACKCSNANLWQSSQNKSRPVPTQWIDTLPMCSALTRRTETPSESGRVVRLLLDELADTSPEGQRDHDSEHHRRHALQHALRPASKDRRHNQSYESCDQDVRPTIRRDGQSVLSRLEPPKRLLRSLPDLLGRCSTVEQKSSRRGIPR